MPHFNFTKMHGAGNDFILAFSPDGTVGATVRDLVRKIPGTIVDLCDRKRGIGADGMIFLSPSADKKDRYRMDFYNCDGSRASMCGNGLRCAALFVKRHGGCSSDEPVFETDSGVLDTHVFDSSAVGRVRISILLNEPFRDLGMISGYRIFFGVAGVPHAVVPVENTDAVDVDAVGRMLRFHEAFSPAGTNVDFVELHTHSPDGCHRIRTYERGVEGETLACGTGITSAGVV